MRLNSQAKTPIPSLIYGTAWKKEKTAELVVQAILHGFRGIDTACQPKHYNEAGVGHALQLLKKEGIARETLFLQTKFTPISGQDVATVPYNPYAPLPEQVRQSFSMSQKNLTSEYIDSLVLHSPLQSHDQTMAVWLAMEELCQQGWVGKLGISNCYDLEDLKLLHDQASIKPSFVQNRFYGATGYDKHIRQWCLETDIHYQSFWTLTANPHIINHPDMASIAMARHRTPAQVFLRFLSQLKIIPLIGACSIKHMQDDLAIFQFELNDQEMHAISMLLEQAP